ncbi:MAG: hypothetical protein A3F73_03705 [Gallionellales bacterium RIFCSPLOWO2_12_FULL_59_22]|nr:MAG: hypothetical protein A3H99_01025 [Gallionellales bacterium RIFCSPLOWO2_02_FULL_59_110]OGT01430.1 MAG: hypothetical protein A2Z65_13765 [Gallionellales bacterium RIFCSPLOWO2_02_58_13]OGT14491.1 MAG: hypothetical protein A3F73_03705 [Gallionellales bacterium RIFCSPLOWO2_12_FULL_59_22]
MAEFTRKLILVAREFYNLVAARLDELSGPGDGEIMFRCNVCGRMSVVGEAKLTREEATCRCGSSVRLRSIVHVLTLELFGKSLAIPDIPVCHGLVGIDMSGAANYAERLVGRIGYVNTFLHKEPCLDIVSPGKEWLSRCDFVISSDVFEHVAPPVSRAFDNTFRLLKPGGIFVFTVPYTKGGATVEHFPELSDYRIERRDGKRILVNRLFDGRIQEFDDLVFHGGEGETLEMRVFSESGVLGELARAGFSDIRIHAEPCVRFGIVWEHPWSLPITAKRPAASSFEP